MSDTIKYPCLDKDGMIYVFPFGDYPASGEIWINKQDGCGRINVSCSEYLPIDKQIDHIETILQALKQAKELLNNTTETK